MKKLGVNIDHVATLRQARRTSYPDVLSAGLMVEEAGANSITVHLREDLRHIQPYDVLHLKKELKIPLNLELAATKAQVLFATQVMPTYCCFVPERREELTTEGGLDVVSQEDHLSLVCADLKQAGVVVSFFVDANKDQIKASKACGADAIELHTGEYAHFNTQEEQEQELEKLKKAATYAASLGLQVNAGHGLHLGNTAPIVAIPEVVELNIGHAIVSRAVMVGLFEAVKEMLHVVQYGG